MATTPQNDFPLLEEGQGETIFNTLLRALDCLAGTWRVQNKTRTSPPSASSSNTGKAWLVLATGSGAWTGHDNDIAIYTGSGWVYITPQEGTIIVDISTDDVEIYDGSSWTDLHTSY